MHARTAPAAAQASSPQRRHPLERDAPSSPAVKASVPVSAHDDGFKEVTKYRPIGTQPVTRATPRLRRSAESASSRIAPMSAKAIIVLTRRIASTDRAVSEPTSRCWNW